MSKRKRETNVNDPGEGERKLKKSDVEPTAIKRTKRQDQFIKGLLTDDKTEPEQFLSVFNGKIQGKKDGADDQSTLERQLSFGNENILSPSSSSSCVCMNFGGTTPRSRNELATSESDPNSVEGIRLDSVKEEINNQGEQLIDINAELRKRLQRNYVRLKSELEPDELADQLLAHEVMTDSQRAEVQDFSSRLTKNEIIIQCIVNYSNKINKNDGSLLYKLKDALKKAKLEHLLKIFEKESSENSTDASKNANTLTFSDDSWIRQLDAFRRLKGDEVNPMRILDKLLSKEVLNFNEHENIKDIDRYADKMEVLVQYVQQKSVKEFNKFVDVIKEEYPIHVDGFDMEHTMETLQAPEHSPNLHLSALTIHGYPDTVDASKLILKCDDDGRDVEQMIVDNLTSQEHPDLIQQTMEFAALGIKNITFSSISLTIKCLSRQSQMNILQKCKESPNYLLKLIQPLFRKDDVRRFHEKGVSLIHVKLNILWQDCSVTKKDIATNFCFLKENMVDPLDITSEFPATHFDHLKSLKTKPERCAAFLIEVVNSDDDSVARFYNVLQKLKLTEILRTAEENSKDLNHRKCCCKLSKDLITKYFSNITERMTCVKEILTTFTEFPLFNDSDRFDLQMLKLEVETSDKEHTSSWNDAFLRKVLNMQCDDLEVCLLNKELHRTKQEDLVKQVIEMEKQFKSDVTSVRLTKDDISRNHYILLNELEPRNFIGIFDGSKLNEEKENVLSTSDRRERCKIFLNALKSDLGILTKFAKELERMRLTKIFKIFLEGRSQGSAELQLTKADIRNNEGFLKEELEPRKFLKMLRDVKLRGVKDTDLLIEKILSSSPKRQLRNSFFEFLIDGPESDTSVLQLFKLELENQGMEKILNFLINSRDEDFNTEMMREAVISVYANIVEEIEPEHLRQVFIERKVISTEVFDAICRQPRRRERAVLLLQDVLEGRPAKAHCLLNALEANGYISLVKKITAEIRKYQTCQRLFKIGQGYDNGFVIEGNIKLDSQDSQEAELNNPGVTGTTLPSKSIDRLVHTKMWVAKSTGVTACVDHVHYLDGHLRKTSGSDHTIEPDMNSDLVPRVRMRKASSLCTNSSPLSFQRNGDEINDGSSKSSSIPRTQISRQPSLSSDDSATIKYERDQ